MSKKIIIFGQGEIADLAHFYFKSDSKYEIVAFCVDDKFLSKNSFNNLPLIALSELEKIYPPDLYSAHVALSYDRLNKNRKEKFNYFKKIGYHLVSYVCSKSFFWNDLSHGENCFIWFHAMIPPHLCAFDEARTLLK